MRKGFILGKFMPLHKGHLALIEFARKHCDHLSIIICFTANEPIEGVIRKQWLSTELQHSENISLILFPYDENRLPNTSESSREISMKWASAFKEIVTDSDVVFTSEPYGDYLAEYMGIEHIGFNEKRNIVPVSASSIRDNPFNFWNFLADAVKPCFVKKVVLLGTESTGKSTLTEKLANHFETLFVPEMAREVIEKTIECTPDHLVEIAGLHAKRIIDSLSSANKLLFIDTDITITKSYSRFLFNEQLRVDKWIEEANKADLYLYLEPDCPFVQDGTRLDKELRNKLSMSHKKELERNNISFIPVIGNWSNRFESACSIISATFDIQPMAKK